MRRKITQLGLFIAVVGIAAILWQCKDEETKYGTVSGKVSLLDGTIASGAIVSLSTEALGAGTVTRIVADTNGAYALPGVKEGSYYINATFEPSNNNNLEKAAGTVILTGEEQQISVGGDLVTDIVLSGKASNGTGMVDLADGWSYDAIHSRIGFEFPYDAVDAIFTGHFANTGLDEFYFDEQNPADTKIKAWVDLISIETGSPSDPCGHTRDGISGCIAGTFGIQKDINDTIEVYCSDGNTVVNWPNDTAMVSENPWTSGTSTYKRPHAVVGTTGVATFEAKEVKAYGSGYIAKGDFTFKEVTKSVDLYFSFLDGYTKADNTKTYCSLYGSFKFAALTDFAISSGHVGGNDVTVRISIQFVKTL